MLEKKSMKLNLKFGKDPLVIKMLRYKCFVMDNEKRKRVGYGDLAGGLRL